MSKKIIIGFVVLGGIAWLIDQRDWIVRKNNPKETTESAAILKDEVKVSGLKTTPVIKSHFDEQNETRQLASQVDIRSMWKKIERRYGKHLTPRYFGNRLVEIKGSVLRPRTKKNRFNPARADQLLSRSQEIFEDIRPLLGNGQPVEFLRPMATTGKYSGQTFYQQSVEGYPLKPFGNVTIDLGPQGEVIRVSSDVVPGIQVKNEKSLSVEQAEKSALTWLKNEHHLMDPLRGGEPIVWVPRPETDGLSVDAYYAYDFYVSGSQLVVDAQDGAIHFYRSIKNH